MKILTSQARFGLLMSALALASAPTAFAQESTCTTDTDCEHGYECLSISACPDIACVEGQPCEPIDCEESSSCVPKQDCTADAECSAGWKCATVTYEECDAGGSAEPAPACKPEDPDCVNQDPPQNPEPEQPPSCETIEDTYCAPPWVLPCETADDCGPGFECEEIVRGSCPGSAGSSGGGSEPSPGDMGAAPPEDLIAPPECTEEATGVFACVLIATPCMVDADCGAGLTCQEEPSATVCSGGAAPTPGDSGSGGADGSGDAPPPPDSDADRAIPSDCTMAEPTYACAPPDYYTGYDTVGRGEASSGGDIDNGGGTQTGGGLVNPIDDGDDEGGEEPPAFGSPGAGDPNAESASGDTMESSGGCSAAGAGGSGSALMMLLAVLGLATRRRKHA